MPDLDRITGDIVNAAIHIHSRLGPGLLESVYETIIARDLSRKGWFVETQKAICFDYEGLWFDNVFRADLIVEHAVVVEVKSLPALLPVHEKQLLTYLRVLDYRVGLLLNFGVAMMRDGIKRMVNGY
jgi:iron complex transport system substrate-binding protein